MALHYRMLNEWTFQDLDPRPSLLIWLVLPTDQDMPCSNTSVCQPVQPDEDKAIEDKVSRALSYSSNTQSRSRDPAQPYV